MRRRQIPEPVGLSVLDLVCGLFGLIVVLYAITERDDGDIGVSALPLKFIRIQLEGTITAPVGLEIGVASDVFRSWPDCADVGVVTWGSCEAGVVEALIESADPIDSIRFLLLAPPTSGGAMVYSDVDVWISTPEDRRFCTLSFANAYRGNFEDASCESG